MEAMNEVITFDTMPKAIAYLIGKIESLEKVVLSMGEVPSTPVDSWFDIYELSEYLPDHPAKQTIYGWVHSRVIPYHKGGKKLRFLGSVIILGDLTFKLFQIENTLIFVPCNKKI